MAKDQKIGKLWKLLFSTVTCLSFALPVLSDSSKLKKTSGPGEFNLQSTLPTPFKWKMVRLPDGTMLQTVPKRFSSPAFVAGKVPGQHIIYRIPDCGKNLCKNGWCEETMIGYNCHCSSGFQGRHCNEQITESTTEATTKHTTSPTTTMSTCSDTTTFKSTISSTKSESRESSTTGATIKPTTNPTTTKSDTTTPQETTLSACSSPPVGCEYDGSSYNFSTCKMNQASAVSACSQYGSHLVFIESQEEQDFIVEFVREDYWIGLTGSSLDDARWLDGSSLTYSNFNVHSFAEWNPNCFRINYNDHFTWHDRNCSKQFSYICEKEMEI